VSARTLGEVLTYAGSTLLQYGERSRAEELFAQVNELATMTHDANLLLWPNRIEIRGATLDGDLEGAVRASERFVARADELGAPVLGGQYATDANYGLAHLGRGEEALTRMGAARELAGIEAVAAVPARTAQLLAHAGRSEEAREMLRRVMVERNIAREENEISTPLLLHLLEAAVMLEESETAHALAGLLDSVRFMSLHHNSYACPARLLGAAAALLGNPDEARAFYQEALDACAKIRHRPEIALTRLELAELLLEHYPDERAEALDHLDFAISEFREMKMQPSLERALRHRGLLKA
jgi:tetratricopeptide (TPR) repeat protein